MIYSSRGIVLKVVKYSETTIFATIYTLEFGLQQYKIPGIRITSKKGLQNAVYFQPAAILQFEIYHNQLKQLQYIKNYSWYYLYQYTFFNVIKNAICNYLVEIILHTIHQPEANKLLYEFLESMFMLIDKSNESELPNIPIFFLTRYAYYLGIEIQPNESEINTPYLNLQQGHFIAENLNSPYCLNEHHSKLINTFILLKNPSELIKIKLNRNNRAELLKIWQLHYSLHGKDINQLKTLPILQQILE